MNQNVIALIKKLNKSGLICLSFLMLSMLSFSQTTSKDLVKITKDSLVLIHIRQIKLANKIFVEHKEYNELIKSYKQQVADMQKTLHTYQRITSNQKEQIDLLKCNLGVLKSDLLDKDRIIDEKEILLQKKQKKLRRTRKITIPVAIGLGGLLLWKIMK